MENVLSIQSKTTNLPSSKLLDSQLETLTAELTEWMGTAYQWRKAPSQELVEKARDLLPSLARKLDPASPEQFAVVMAKLTDFVRVFGLPLDDLRKATGMYHEALSDLPADLAMEAVKRTIVGHKYHVLPKPADIRERIETDLAKRKATRLYADMCIKGMFGAKE